MHRISSGFTLSFSNLITLNDNVVVFPVPGFDTTMVSFFESTISLTIEPLVVLQSFSETTMFCDAQMS